MCPFLPEETRFDFVADAPPARGAALAVMNIIDLQPRHEVMFSLCLEDRQPEAIESGDHRARWIRTMKDRGLRAKLAVDEHDAPVGMIQYVPAARTLLVADPGSYFVHCIWVTRFDDDRGNHQGRGIGTALLKAAEEDARALGATGMAAWGLVLPVWMKASWFRKRGYGRADRSGMAALMWKPFVPGIPTPRWVRRRKTPQKMPGQVTVTSLLHGVCRAGNVAHERARRACAEIGGRVVYRVVNTLDPAVAQEWGMLDALFVDDREVRTAPPPSYEDLKRAIERRMARLP